MTKFRVRYSKEFTKTIYAKNREEAMYKFNKQADVDSDFIDAEEDE